MDATLTGMNHRINAPRPNRYCYILTSSTTRNQFNMGYFFLGKYTVTKISFIHIFIYLQIMLFNFIKNIFFKQVKFIFNV